MRIRQLMQEMISLTWSQTPERENRLFLLFSLLLCEISELCADTTNRMISDPVVEEIIRLIHATPQTFFSAHEIASRYFICERTLNNRFHQSIAEKLFPPSRWNPNWKWFVSFFLPSRKPPCGKSTELWIL
ncbi:MAG: hypothetical protein ACLR78_01825 [Roseburia sp.]